MITSAFTCTGPYAVLVMLGIKRVENRGMSPFPAKGRCAVTCSKKFCAAEFGAFVAWAATHLSAEDFARLPSWNDVKDWPGKVIGCCDYAVRPAASPFNGVPREPWDEGYGYWWDLSNVVCFDRPIPCRGNVGMWQMPPALAQRVGAQDALASCVGERIATAQDAERLFRLALPPAGGNEGFFVLPLDDDRRALSEPVLVSLGDPSTTAVRPRDVFGVAFKTDAAALVLAHNHPGGNPAPSAQDIGLTAALTAFGDGLGVKILDHLILTPSYDTVLFDLDGTLTDSAPGILNAIKYALAHMRRPVPDAATLNLFIGPPLVDSFRRHCNMTAAEGAEALAYYRTYFTATGIFENSVYAGVVPMLERLKAAGKKIILATAKPETFARRILDHFDLTRWFDAIHGATLDETRNRKQEVVAWALTHSGEIGRALMVGDRANDVEGARANGIDALGVLYGYGDESELRAAGAKALAATPADVARQILDVQTIVQPKTGNKPKTGDRQ